MKPFTLPHFRKWAKKLELDNGDPWKLEPFQEAFIEDVFSGTPICWLVIPQGNGKTTLIAGLALYHIEHTKFASLVCAAKTRDQAMVLYGQAAAFIVRSGLEGTFRYQNGYRRILCDEANSLMQVFASDVGGGDAIIPTFCIIDELHRLRDLELYRLWLGKMKKRGAQMIVISTAGEPGGEFEEQREQMRQMAEELEREETFVRASGPRYVLHDWSLPEDGDHNDIALVARANPLSTITEPVLEEERNSPDWNLQHWRRLTCNVPDRGSNAAITEAEWAAAKVDEDIPKGERVWVGLDIGWKKDTTFAVPLWVGEEYRLLGVGKCIVPPSTGDSTHPDTIKNALLEIHARTPIHTVVMDMSNAEDIGHWIEDETGWEVIDHGQTNAHHCANYDKFMEGLRQGDLKHAGDPQLSRHVLNAIARPATYGDLRFDRPTQSRTDPVKQVLRVIDGLTAAAMVNWAAVQVEDAPMFVSLAS